MSTNTVPLNTQVNVRLDTKIKAEADAVLSQLGISTSDFFRMALHQVVLRKGLPFEVKIPNAETQAAIDVPLESRMRFSSMEEVMAVVDALPDED